MNTASLIEQHGLKVRELVRFAWNRPDALPMITTGQPSTSLLNSGHQASRELVIAPYRFRFSESGNQIVILANDPVYTSDYSSNLDFLIYDVEKKTTRKIGVSMSDDGLEEFEVVDFFLGENQRLFVLERLLTREKKTINKLRYVEAEGEVIWNIELPPGKNTALLKETKGSIFLQAETSAKTSILKIDSTTSKADVWVTLDHNIPKIFIDDVLQVHYAAFIQEANNRAHISYDPSNGKQEVKYAGDETYAMLGFPSAMDVHNNIYTAEGLSFSCLSSDLSLKWTFSVNNIVLDSGRLFASHFDKTDKRLVVYVYEADGSLKETIEVPIKTAGLRVARLDGLVNSGDFVIETYQGETKSYWVYETKSKTMDHLPETAQVKRFQLQAAATWQIDKAGNLYLPVSSAEGFHIVKVLARTHANHED
jgi:hypothetical protein